MNCPKCNEKACICTQTRGATTLLGASAGGYVAATAGAKTGAAIGSLFCLGIGTSICTPERGSNILDAPPEEEK